MVQRIAKSPLISLAVDKASREPLFRQVFDQLRDHILGGAVAPGTLLPSTRVLAGELGVSRNTVLAAYDQLYAEGYVEGRSGSGTRVSQVLPEDLLTARAAPPDPAAPPAPAGKLSRLATRLEGGSGSRAGAGIRRSPDHRPAFKPGLPEVETFPFDVWGRLLGRLWRHPPRDLVHSGDKAGYAPLRSAIAQYLRAVRGLTLNGDQVIITSGAQQAIDLITRAVIDPGDEVWLEDPGYAGLRSAVEAAGAHVVPVPVDGDGLSVAAGRRAAPKAVMAAVTPSHQYPLGVTLSLGRRLELLDWARQAGAWILEDDYDSEYRYAGRPLSALQGLDDGQRVIYVGTFSKVLFPTLRLGYIVAPPGLAERLIELRMALDDQPSAIVQPVLAEFITEGHFAAHVRRMRKLYAERQQFLLGALERHLSGVLAAGPDEAGMHLVARLGPECTLSDGEISARAEQAGLTVHPLSAFAHAPEQRPREDHGVLLGYAGLNEDAIDDGIQRLAAALQS